MNAHFASQDSTYSIKSKGNVVNLSIKLSIQKTTPTKEIRELSNERGIQQQQNKLHDFSFYACN